MKTPSIGRIVHYKLYHGPNAGEDRPAIIVQVHSTTCLTLRVFTGIADSSPDCMLVTSVLEGADNGQWHWPEKVGD